MSGRVRTWRCARRPPTTGFFRTRCAGTAPAPRSCGSCDPTSASGGCASRLPGSTRPGPATSCAAKPFWAPLRRRRYESSGTVMSLQDFLQSQGVPEEEIRTAAHEGPEAVQLLAIDRLLVPGTKRYTQREIVERTGVDLETARRLWRAIGFPDVPEDEP